MGYADKNADWIKYAEFISDKTGRRGNSLWVDNARENRQFFKESGSAWATVDLQDTELCKTVVMIGASPALANQLDTLRELQHDNDFVLFGISCNLKYLLDNGIKPKYVITVDPHWSQGDFWKDLDMEKTKDVTLITNVFSYPPMLKKWKGPLKWLYLASEDKDHQRKLKKWYKPVNGLGYGFPALMGQFNIGMAFSVLCLGCKVVIFVGNELSYATEKAPYYVHGVPDEKDLDKRYPAMDIYGKVAYTSYMLWALKVASEYFIDTVKNIVWWFNCTEAGIFGVSKRNRNESHIWQLTLKNGIAQARHIMRTGEPFYAYSPGSIVSVPERNVPISLSSFQ